MWLVLWYLRFWARLALAIHKPKIIGITGSVGKTSARNAIFCVLNGSFNVKMIGGNSQTGVPLGILGLKPYGYSALDWLSLMLKAPFGVHYIKNTQWLVVEMGIDGPLPPANMQYLTTIVKPDIAVYLGVAPVHTMQFEEYAKAHGLTPTEAIAREKAFIIQPQAQMVFYQPHDELVVKEIEKRKGTKPFAATRFIPFSGDTGDEFSITYEAFKPTLTGTTFAFGLNNQKTKYTITMKNYALPKETLSSIKPSILIGLYLGVPVERIVERLGQAFTPPAGRCTLLSGVNETTVLDGSYNASRASVLAALGYAKAIKQEYKKPIVAVLGDMRELGSLAPEEHHAVAQELIDVADYVYTVGPLAKEYIAGYLAQKKAVPFFALSSFLNSRTLGQYLKRSLVKDSFIVVKGSQNTIFLEEAVAAILKNPKDARLLCRQDTDWKRKKDHFFATLGK